MSDNVPLVEQDNKQLEQLDTEIAAARQHLEELTHGEERSFIEDGTEDQGEVDNNIAPPG